MKHGRRFIDRTGMKYGRLTVISFVRPEGNGIIWTCKCECGILKQVLSSSLQQGSVKSCGCLLVERSRDTHTKHGASRTPAYRSWEAMKSRCSNPKSAHYKFYGGAGVKVCKRWVDSFSNFLKDLGPRPAGTTLDRIDRSKDYSLENCRWANAETQQNNRSNNKLLTHLGKTQTAARWAREVGFLDRFQIYDRLRLGWNHEKILTTPLIQQMSRRQT